MFSVPRGEIVLGQATVLVQDWNETVPRVTKCDMVAAGAYALRVLRRMLKRFIKKLGQLAGFAAFVAWMSHTQPGFDATRHLPMVMGAITSAVCTSFKSNLGLALHDFTVTTGHSVKTALYTSSATLGATTTAYAGTNEVANGNGYTTTGVVIANVTPTTSGTTAIYDWADAQWTSATFTANGCLVYDDTVAGDKSLFVIAFGSDQTVTAGTFTIQWPTADASNAIIRIA